MDEISVIVDEKATDLSSRPVVDAWAACAAVWGRTVVMATPGWAKWPTWLPKIEEAIAEAINVCVGASLPERRALQVLGLKDFDIEDDGSNEWQYVMDMVSMLLIVLQLEEPITCVKRTLSWYLEGTFNTQSNDFTVSFGRPTSQAEARQLLAGDVVWNRAVAFVRAL